MAYDNGYYGAYARFLQEETVRRAHDTVFAIARRRNNSTNSH